MNKNKNEQVDFCVSTSPHLFMSMTIIDKCASFRIAYMLHNGNENECYIVIIGNNYSIKASEVNFPTFTQVSCSYRRKFMNHSRFLNLSSFISVSW